MTKYNTNNVEIDYDKLANALVKANLETTKIKEEIINETNKDIKYYFDIKGDLNFKNFFKILFKFITVKKEDLKGKGALLAIIKFISYCFFRLLSVVLLIFSIV